MSDFISREAAIKLFNFAVLDCLGMEPAIRAGDIIKALESIPAADVRPVVRGKWIDRDDKYYGWNMWACSACGEEFVLTEGTPDMNEYHFCPNCGADMRPAQMSGANREEN